ncbi:MAG: hypothetical protein LDL53_12655 [Candidatus Hydrogenedens sp.]|nr:hypothetical protein [Candidatus Hydrogenedens sp.]
MKYLAFLEKFKQPPREYSVMPFWFLNDELEEGKIQECLNDFIDHGVYGVVPHPRIGLPESIGFMSERWLYFLRIIIEFAHSHEMKVILYDEGMYPSGSCAGQVVQKNPKHSARALIRRLKGKEPLKEGEEIIFADDKYDYIHTRSMGTIRGVHFGTDDGDPGAPPAGDILNPEAVASFIELVHEKYYSEFKEYFGNTVIGIFTDEPNPLGRKPIKDAQPWTWGMLDFISDYLGYDFKQYIPMLWDKETAETQKIRKDYYKAVQKRLEIAFYKPCSDWCETHNIALTGHPKSPMDIHTLKYFHIPGQDIVWRWVEPFKENSIEGPESTGPKGSASAKIHHRRKRNLNECFGAYGWNLTYEEMEWLTGWLLVRGVDLLVPHAFYYSIKGPRRDERPPDVGPNNIWWNTYKKYADKCGRLCWFIADGNAVADVAILADVEFLPWNSARILYENQIDFFYLDIETLMREDVIVSGEDIQIDGAKYHLLVIDGIEQIKEKLIRKLEPLNKNRKVVTYKKRLSHILNHAGTDKALLNFIRNKIQPDILLYPPTPSIRYYHAKHGDIHGYLFFNEGKDEVNTKISVREKGKWIWLDPNSGDVKPIQPPNNLILNSGEMMLLLIVSEDEIQS